MNVNNDRYLQAKLLREAEGHTPLSVYSRLWVIFTVIYLRILVCIFSGGPISLLRNCMVICPPGGASINNCFQLGVS